jgi:hypothetical protein
MVVGVKRARQRELRQAVRLVLVVLAAFVEDDAALCFKIPPESAPATANPYDRLPSRAPVAPLRDGTTSQ